jgi:hypothetical protein
MLPIPTRLNPGSGLWIRSQLGMPQPALMPEQKKENAAAKLKVKIAFRILFEAKDTSAKDLARANEIWKQCNIEFEEVKAEKKVLDENETVKLIGADLIVEPYMPDSVAVSKEAKKVISGDNKPGIVYVYYLKGLAQITSDPKGGTRDTVAPRHGVMVGERHVLMLGAKMDGYNAPLMRSYASIPFPEVLAHELGHVLGLDHVKGSEENDRNYLMHKLSGELQFDPSTKRENGPVLNGTSTRKIVCQDARRTQGSLPYWFRLPGQSFSC